MKPKEDKVAEVVNRISEWEAAAYAAHAQAIRESPRHGVQAGPREPLAKAVNALGRTPRSLRRKSGSSSAAAWNSEVGQQLQRRTSTWLNCAPPRTRSDPRRSTVSSCSKDRKPTFSPGCRLPPSTQIRLFRSTMIALSLLPLTRRCWTS